MSKRFNEQEKEMIKNSLIEQARMLFKKFGFQKTSILEITQSVGIAQGTFYNFFHSKEELYFIILELEEEKIKEQFANVDVFKDSQPNKAIKNMLRQMVKTFESNPLIRELYFGNNMRNMLNKLPAGTLEKHFKDDADSLLPLIEKLKSEGIMLDEKPEIIAGVLRSLFILTLHQKEIGEANYQQTIELFIDLIVDGLVK